MSGQASLSGYVLVGGRSSRMGRDKAMLPFAGTVLVDYVAGIVRAAVGTVTLVGPPETYEKIGYRVIPDLRPGRGPLAGIEAALTDSETDWNLVIACDMPGITAELLAAATGRLATSEADCVVPISGGGKLETLCAVWRRSCLGAVRERLDEGRNAIKELLPRLDVEFWRPEGEGWSDNWNTPADWARRRNE